MRETHLVIGPACASFLEAVRRNSKWEYGLGIQTGRLQKGHIH